MSFLNGVGFHSVWGSSPSINLLEYHPTDTIECSGLSDPTRILLLCPSDPRHIMKTIANSLRTDDNHRSIHFYIMETSLELLARHLLLLYVFFDFKVPIRQRASQFLEIFGNCLLSKRTGDYLERCASILYEQMNEPFFRMEKSWVDFTSLKQRDRDELSNIFSSWLSPEPFDVVSLRDQRLRSYYGNRYECRENLIDWDYQTGIKPVATIIHSSEFLNWRMSGVAFQFEDRTFSTPNKSTATKITGVVCRGEVKPIRGYWLDILIGPYISFGIACDQRDECSDHLFQVINKGSGAEQHRHNSTEISLYNIISLMWELETGQRYKMAENHDIFSGLGNNYIVGEDSPCNIAIIPVLGVDLEAFSKKKKFHNHFDHIYVSQHMTQQLESESLPVLLGNRCRVVSVEGPRFIFHPSYSSHVQKDECWNEKLTEIVRKRGFRPLALAGADRSTYSSTGTNFFTLDSENDVARDIQII